jgi:hypothetical protein
MPPFYAELLPNIGSISLTVSLPSPASLHTRLFVPHCSSSATLDHDGESTSVILPVQANPHTSILVFEAGIGQKALSCRLPVALPFPPGVTRGPGSANWAPWSAPELLEKPTASFSCRTCSAVVIPSGRIQQWKDLPSGNWADMMDFWHCHKPHGGDESSDSKYSVFERGFVIEAGTGLVDRGYFLLSPEDCEAVQVSRCSGLSMMSPPLPCFLLFFSSSALFEAFQGLCAGYQEGVQRPVVVSPQWLAHRYKYPRLTQLATLSSNAYDCLSSRYGVDGFTLRPRDCIARRIRLGETPMFSGLTVSTRHH